MTRHEALLFAINPVQEWTNDRVASFIDRIYDEIENKCQHDYKEFSRTVQQGDAFNKEAYYRCTKCLKETDELDVLR